MSMELETVDQQMQRWYCWIKTEIAHDAQSAASWNAMMLYLPPDRGRDLLPIYREWNPHRCEIEDVPPFTESWMRAKDYIPGMTPYISLWQNIHQELPWHDLPWRVAGPG